MSERPQQRGPRARPGATRCPFCHDECAAEDDACACAACLSRHHRRCWDEGGGCSSCRATERLDPAKPATAATAAKRLVAALSTAAPSKTDSRGYGEAIDAWLKLALVYNGVLLLVTLVCANVSLFNVLNLIGAAFGALAANLCYLIGPAIEVIARRLGYRGSGLRAVVFSIGLLIAVVLTLECCRFLT